MEAVIFDWGGTLSVWADIDVEDVWRLAARHIAPDQEEELTARLVEVEQRSWQRTQTDRRSTRLNDLLSEASSELGVDVAAAVLEEAALHHLDSWTPHIRHHLDAAPALTELRDMGLRIGLLSNTHWPPSFHEHFLARDGLDELIDVRLYTSEMDVVKPDPFAFQAVLEALDTQDAAFVGDRLYDDIWGAQQVGLKAVWVRNSVVPNYNVAPDAIVDRLAEVPGVVRKWVA